MLDFPRLSTVSNYTKVNINIDGTAVFSALVEAFPIPPPGNFTWMKCDHVSGICEEIYTNNHYIVHVEIMQTYLIVRDVQDTDFGQYTLVVSNGIGIPLEATSILAEIGKLTEFCYSFSRLLIV